MNIQKVTRIEIIDHTRPLESGGGRVYTYWSEYDKTDVTDPTVELLLQDDGKTLKIFISHKEGGTL